MNGTKMNAKEHLADVPRNSASVLRVYRRRTGKRELLDLQVCAVPPAEDAPQLSPPGQKGDGFLPVAGLELTAERKVWERFAQQVLNMEAKGSGRSGTEGARPGSQTPPAPRGELTAS